MKKLSKMVSLLLAAVMVLSVVGCGKPADKTTGTQTPDSSGESTAQSGSQEDQENTDEEIVELTMAYLVFSNPPSDMQLVADEINKISEPEIGVRINIQAINAGDYATQVNLMFNSGESLDIVQALTTNFSSWYSNGSLVSFSDELEQYGQGIKEAVGEAYLKAGQVNGEQYGITTNRDLATGYGFNIRTYLTT